MPGNTVNINGCGKFYVGDSKMSKLMKLLKEISHPRNKEAKLMLKEEGGRK